MKLQYTLSKETTDYLKQPTFDMWHWEPNEVSLVLLLLLWPPYVIGGAIIFLPCSFFLLLSFFPRLISAVGDWMSTILLHMAWP